MPFFKKRDNKVTKSSPIFDDELLFFMKKYDTYQNYDTKAKPAAV